MIVKSVAEQFGIDEEHIEEHGNEIFEYVYYNLIQNRMIYHMTNSVIAEEIKQEGLKPISNTQMNGDIKDIIDKIKKYSPWLEENLFPYVLTDIKGEGIYFDEIPCNIGTYFYSPEWLKCFCSGAAQLAERQETGDAFLKRDYQSVLENIGILTESYNFNEADANALRGFLDKYWEKFKNATPTLILIPSACLNDDKRSFFNSESFAREIKKIRDGYVDTSYSHLELKIMEKDESQRQRIEKEKKEKIERQKKEHSSVYYKVEELIKLYKSMAQFNRTTKDAIAPEYLSFADVSPLVPEKYRHTLKAAKESGMISWEDIAKGSLEMQVTSEEAAIAQDIEDRYVKKEGELQIDDE